MTSRAITLMALAAVVAAAGGCKYGTGVGPDPRAVHVVPAFVGQQGGELLDIDPAWEPSLPDRVGNRPEEVVGLSLFDRYLFPGESATALVRLNARNLPLKHRVFFELWDENGLNILWKSSAVLETGTTHLVQVGPVADSSLSGSRLQLRIWPEFGAIFMRTEKLVIIPPAPAAGLAFKIEDPEDVLSTAVRALPLPPGPIGPDTDALCLVGTPGETVSGAAVFWPNQRLTHLAGAVEPAGPEQLAAKAAVPPFYLGQVTSMQSLVRGQQAAGDLPEGGLTLDAGQTGIFGLRVAIPADAPACSMRGHWRIEKDGGLIFLRPVYLTVFDVKLPPGATLEARYVAAWRQTVEEADGRGGRAASVARGLDREVEAAVDHYASRPGPGPAAELAPADRQIPFKLRWLILNAIDQVRRAR